MKKIGVVTLIKKLCIYSCKINTRNWISSLKNHYFDTNHDKISKKRKISKFSRGQNERGHLGMMPDIFFCIMVIFRTIIPKEQNKTICRLVGIRAGGRQFSCITDQTSVPVNDCYVCIVQGQFINMTNII